MYRVCILAILLLLCPIVSVAQGFRQLVEEVGRFDHEYPRESVFLQMDGKRLRDDAL